MEFTKKEIKIFNALGAFSTIKNFATIVEDSAPSSIVDNDFYSLDEVAQILSISKFTLRNSIGFYNHDVLNKSNTRRISSNEIAKLVYKLKHRDEEIIHDPMLVIYDTNVETRKIYNYHFVRVQDVIDQIKKPSLMNIIQFFHYYFQNPLGTVHIDPIFHIEDFFIKAGKLPPRQQIINKKLRKDLYRSVVNIIDHHSIELEECLKQAYFDSLFFKSKKNGIIQVFANSSGDLRHSLVYRELQILSEDEYLYYQFECQDITKLLKQHYLYQLNDTIYQFILENGWIEDFVNWLIHTGELSEDVFERQEDTILMDYFGKKRSLSLLKNIKAWNREKYLSLLNELLCVDEKVMNVLKEIVMRKEFTKEKWEWTFENSRIIRII